MRIAIFYHQNPILAGLHDAFVFSGHQVLSVHKSIAVLDVFDNFAPELIIISGEDDSFELQQGLEEYPETKVVMFGMAAPEGLKIDLLVWPSDFLPSQIESSIPWIQLPIAANTVRFRGGSYKSELNTDCLFISDLSGPKVNQYIQQLLMPNTDLQLKIIGPPLPFSSTQYLGNCDDKTLNDMICSSKVIFDFNQYHYFDYFANKVFCYELLINDKINIDEIQKYVRENKLREKIIKNKYKEIISEHTYIHRMNKLLESLQNA